MAERVTVNFFYKDRPAVQWAWFDASGYVPVPGDYVITPRGSRWKVLARTWHQHVRGGRAEMDCNVVVVDVPPFTSPLSWPLVRDSEEAENA